ncbi:uncharacterized protein LOC117123063 isoform X2 [Anneissia japonica]|uniref:uncharacterized protein LOC117123063 isoform X2 n=1 Tax=Anneissia japonica TaxID=1529436 RepID=UPI0014259E90|nr:uncharacterized protein LOC117123063 isoform X2 [Anneissia japonica]
MYTFSLQTLAVSVFHRVVGTEENESGNAGKIRPNWHGTFDISLKLVVASRKVHQSFTLLDAEVTRKRVIRLTTLTRYKKIDGINDCLRKISRLTPAFLKTLSKYGYMYGVEAEWFQKIAKSFRKEAMNMFESSYHMHNALIENDDCLLEESINSIIDSLNVIMEIKERIIAEFSKIKHEERGISKEDNLFWQNIKSTSCSVAGLKKILPPAYKVSLRLLIKKVQADSIASKYK